MGCPNSSQLEVPNVIGDEVEDGIETLSLCDGIETLSLCDLPLYCDEGDSVKCDHGRSTMLNKEERDLESFEFSSGELNAFTWREEKIIFCGRIIHSKEQGCTAVRPGKDHPKKDATAMMHRAKRRRRFFHWKLGFFRKPRTGYRKMKQQRRQQRRTDSLGMKGKWYFRMFVSVSFPVEMELRDIKTRQSKRTNLPTMFGLSKRDEAEINEKKASPRNWEGFLNVLRSLSCGRQSWPSGS